MLSNGAKILKEQKEQRFNNSHVSRFECHDWLRHGNPLEPSTAVSRMTGRLNYLQAVGISSRVDNTDCLKSIIVSLNVITYRRKNMLC